VKLKLIELPVVPLILIRPVRDPILDKCDLSHVLYSALTKPIAGGHFYTKNAGFQSVRTRLPACWKDVLDFGSYGSVRRNKGMWKNTEIGVVIHGRIRTCYLCFTHTPLLTINLVFFWKM